MKRKIIMTIAVLVALCGAATDRFYIEDFTIASGETCTVGVLLDNEMEYTAFQSDLYLPEGLAAANFALTDRKNSTHTLTATVLPDGGLRLLSYSVKLKTYSGNSGVLMTFDVTADADFEGPATVRLQGTLFTTVAGVEVPFDDEECSVTLPVIVHLGDVNDDGRVSIKDVTDLINYLLSGNTEGIIIVNADVNTDGRISINDVTSLINMMLMSS